MATTYYYMSVQSVGSDYYFGINNGVVRGVSSPYEWVFATCNGDSSGSNYWLLDGQSGECVYATDNGGSNLHTCSNRDNVYNLTQSPDNPNSYDLVGSNGYSSPAYLEIATSGTAVSFNTLQGIDTGDYNTTLLPYYEWALSIVSHTGTKSLPDVCATSATSHVSTTTVTTTATMTSPGRQGQLTLTVSSSPTTSASTSQTTSVTGNATPTQSTPAATTTSGASSLKLPLGKIGVLSLAMMAFMASM